MTEPERPRRVALVCSQFTMQSAFALLILALNSARLGYETIIYFTFEGLKMIRHGFRANLHYIPTGPEQTEEDVEAIVDLSKRIRHRFLRAARDKGRMGEITLSVNPFVPKPWSPFQWCGMAEEGLLRERLKKIRRSLQKEPNIHVTHGLAKWAYLQALFSRGDRRVLPFVLEGAVEDTSWKQVFRRTTLNPDFFVCRERGRDELFPWDFIDHGVPKALLYREYERRLSCSSGDKPEKSTR